MWRWAPSATNYQGSYAYNGWLYSGNYSVADLLGAPNSWRYSGPNSIPKPTTTPLFADAMWIDGWPKESDGPSTDLYNGNANYDMGRFTIARHGGQPPKSAPRSLASSSTLTGSIDIVFCDAHAGPVKLANLWTLNWHADWVTPATIPSPK
jgi:hypothetical protein